MNVRRSGRLYEVPPRRLSFVPEHASLTDGYGIRLGIGIGEGQQSYR